MVIIEPIHVFLSNNSLKRHRVDVLTKIEDLKRELGLSFDMERGPWVAGGSVLKLVEGKRMGKRDIDIFFSSKDQFKVAQDKLDSLKKSDEWKEFEAESDFVVSLREIRPPSHNLSISTFRTSSAYTYSFENGPVQIIRRKYYNNVNQLLGDFDFTVCMFATDGFHIAYPQVAFDDVQTRTLRLHRVHRDSTLIKRWYKYILNGYTPGPGQTKLIHEIVRENPEKYFNANSYSPDNGGMGWRIP